MNITFVPSYFFATSAQSAHTENFQMSVPRSLTERRSGLDRRNLSVQEKECQRCCRLAGALFVGIQRGHGHVPDLCLFSVEIFGTTLAVPLHDLTPLRIRERMADAAHKPAGFLAWIRSIRVRQPQRGYTIIELLVSMMVMATLMAMTVPALSGVIRAQNEAFAIATLRRVAVAEQVYFAATGNVTCDLAELKPSATMPAGLMDAETASGASRGYKFTLQNCALVTPTTYKFEAYSQPQGSGGTAGTRSFFINQTGNVMQNRTGAVTSPTTDMDWSIL